MIKNPYTVSTVLALGFAIVAGCGDGDGAGSYQGVVELDGRALGFEEGGRLIEVLVHEGDIVEAGAPLARLDPTLAKIERDARVADVDAAEAQLALLRAGARPEQLGALRAELNAARSEAAAWGRQLTQARRLVQAGAAPRSLVDERAAQVSAARGRAAAIEQQLRVGNSGARNEEVDALQARVDAAQDVLALAEERLSRLTLSAPIAATIINVHADPGEVVAPGTPVVSLADAAHPYVDVFVPPTEVNALETGRPMQVRTDALPHGLPGRVEHIGRELEFTPQFLFSEKDRPYLVVRVRVRIDDPAHTLRPGVPAFAKPVEATPPEES